MEAVGPFGPAWEKKVAKGSEGERERKGRQAEKKKKESKKWPVDDLALGRGQVQPLLIIMLYK